MSNIVLSVSPTENENSQDLYEHNFVSGIHNNINSQEIAGSNVIKILTTGYNKKKFKGNEKLLVGRDEDTGQLYGTEIPDIKINNIPLNSGDVISAQNDKTYTVHREDGSVDIILTNAESIYNIKHKDTTIKIEKDKYNINVKGIVFDVTDSKITLTTNINAGTKIQINKIPGNIELSNQLTGQYEILTALLQFLTSHLLPITPSSQQAAQDLAVLFTNISSLFSPKK
jgi:hypothetical protein